MCVAHATSAGNYLVLSLTGVPLPARYFPADGHVKNIFEQVRGLEKSVTRKGQSVAYARTNGIVPPWSRVRIDQRVMVAAASSAAVAGPIAS